MKKYIFLILSCLCLISAKQKSKPTLYIIGDSTVKNGSGKGSDGQFGWGTLIHEHFDTTKIHIKISGQFTSIFYPIKRFLRAMVAMQDK